MDEQNQRERRGDGIRGRGTVVGLAGRVFSLFQRSLSDGFCLDNLGFGH